MGTCFICFVRPRPTFLSLYMCTSLFCSQNLPIPEQEIIVVCAFTIVMDYNLLFMSYSSCSAFSIHIIFFNFILFNGSLNKMLIIQLLEHDIKLFTTSGLLKLIYMCVYVCG